MGSVIEDFRPRLHHMSGHSSRLVVDETADRMFTIRVQHVSINGDLKCQQLPCANQPLLDGSFRIVAARFLIYMASIHSLLTPLVELRFPHSIVSSSDDARRYAIKPEPRFPFEVLSGLCLRQVASWYGVGTHPVSTPQNGSKDTSFFLSFGGGVDGHGMTIPQFVVPF